MEKERVLRTNNRPEFLERSLPLADLLKAWEADFGSLKSFAEIAVSNNDLIDVIRPASLRGAYAKTVNQLEWMHRWYELKHKAFIASLRRRREGLADFKIGVDKNEYGLHLVFAFDVDGKIYKSATSLPNLLKYVSNNELLELTDPFKKEDSAPSQFNLIPYEGGHQGALILSRGFGAGIVIENFAWLKIGKNSETSGCFRMVGLKNNIVTSDPEVHELKWGKTYEFEGTKNRIQFDAKELNDKALVSLVFPKNVLIFREELSPLAILSSR